MSEKRSIGQALFALATLLIAIFGAGIAFLEYRDAQQRARIERVFDYSDKLTDMAEANARISSINWTFLEEIPTILASVGDDRSPEARSAAMEQWFVGKIAADDDLRFAVEQLSLFYDTLSVCVAQGLCDEKTAKDLFSYQTATFTSIAYPWIAARNGGNPRATGVQAACLRNRFCGGQVGCTGLPTQLAWCDNAAPANTNDAKTPSPADGPR